MPRPKIGDSSLSSRKIPKDGCVEQVADPPELFVN